MISDLDIYRAANIIIERYGEKARLHATKRADAMREAGAPDAHAMWKRILRAVEELQRMEAKSGGAVH